MDDFTLEWLAGNALLLTGGAMALVWIADEITKLKLGNGTSILIFVSIVSALPTSLGATLQQAAEQGWGSVGVFLGAFLATCLGIVYVQEAERRIPINCASQYQGRAGFSIGKNAFLPFKVRGLVKGTRGCRGMARHVAWCDRLRCRVGCHRSQVIDTAHGCCHLDS